jgi:hypothetical protein
MKKDRDMNTTHDMTYYGATTQDVVKPEPSVSRLRTELITKDNYKDLPPLRWFVPGWVMQGGTTAVYGEPGSGKSFWSLSLALEAARGGQWCTHDFRTPRRVLYLAPEAGLSHVERVRGWSEKHGHEWPDTFYLAPTQVNVYKDQTVSELWDLIDTLAPLDLVVLDTLASATAGLDENSSQMTVVTENIETIRRALPDSAAFLIVHHSGKDQAKGLRGHTSLLGYVTGSLLVTKEATTNSHRVEAKKVRDGSTPLPQYYRVETVDLPPAPGDLLMREIGVMVSVDYTDAVRDTLTAVYDALREVHHVGDTFTRTEVETLTGLKRTPVDKALKRGIDMGLWERHGAGRTTHYRFVGKPGDVGELVTSPPLDREQ